MKTLFTKTVFICFVLFSIGMLLSQILMAAPADTKSVGTVTFVTGDANIIHKDKSTVKAAKNDVLFAGDAIETKNGRLQLSLLDGGKVSLQPNTTYKINKYEFSGKEDGSEYAFTELVKGGMRTVSGLIGHKNRERYQLKTAVATIGIRGTEFTVNFNDNQLLMTTNHGSVDVCNAAGCLNAMTGQSIIVSGVGAAPKPSGKAAKAAVAPPVSNKAVFAAGEDSTAAENLATTPSTPTTPNVVNGVISTVLKTTSGNGGFDVVRDAQIEVDANNKPSKITIAASAVIQPAAFSQVQNDGVIGWGRIASGTLTTSTNPTSTIEWMDYAIGEKPAPASLVNMAGTYTVFGYTTPTSILAGNTTPTTPLGTDKVANGTFTFNFGTTNYSYNLNVESLGIAYGLSGSGSGLSATNPSFASGGTITGGTCTAGACSGALENGNLIQGSFFGQNGERIGLQYGFNVAPVLPTAAASAVYGTAVLK